MSFGTIYVTQTCQIYTQIHDDFAYEYELHLCTPTWKYLFLKPYTANIVHYSKFIIQVHGQENKKSILISHNFHEYDKLNCS